MALPVTTYQKVESSYLNYIHKTGYRQKRPIDRPLPYTVAGTRRRANSGGDGSWVTTLHPGTLAENLRNESFDWFTTHCQNRLYSRLKGKIQETASLGVSLAEMHQSVEMIRNRATQLFQFGRAVKKFDFVGAAKILRLATVPKGTSVKRSFANNYLEFHFGWSPLVGDIFSAIEVLQSPVSDQFPVASVKQTIPAILPTKAPGMGNGYSIVTYGGTVLRAKMGCRVRIDNSNVNLANQLGLTNPALIAYELVPFSFVANWFISIEEFLSQGTDFLGLTLLDGWHSYGMSRHALQQKGNPFWDPPDVFTLDASYTLTRNLGIVQPLFQIRPFKIWGWRRAAAAVSLVVQQTTTGSGINRR